MAWIDVDERLPEIAIPTKFKVKIKKGSANPVVYEGEVLAVPNWNKVRFLIGDWCRVIAWYEE